MCDTMIVTPEASANGALLFAKNSDRQRNEPQALEIHPGAEHGASDELRCTYLTLQQMRRTRTVLISRPIWGWGAEMGGNDAGVVVGNEGLHAIVPAPKEPALTGMDLVRLALERAGSAAQALETITTLLERHGQGGNCGHDEPAYYHNGFMIADAREGFVLETVGRDWMVARVEAVRAMSNIFSIVKPERTSMGWSALIADDPDNHATAVANPTREHIGQAGGRVARAAALLTEREGELSPADLMRVLRDHGAPSNAQHWDPGCQFDRTICMHAGPLARGGQTTASQVSMLRGDEAVHWVTGTSSPCISLFKPVLLDADLPPFGPVPTPQADASSLWWRHERFHRAAVRAGLPRVVEAIGTERDALEAEFMAQIEAVRGAERAVRSATVRSCWTKALAVEQRWQTALASRVAQGAVYGTPEYAQAWIEMNRRAGLEPGASI